MPEPSFAPPYVCPVCRGSLAAGDGELLCRACALTFQVRAGVADFCRGEYYDTFDESRPFDPMHQLGLDHETSGAEPRIREFYLPLLRRACPEVAAPRVLDCGCGNGLTVDLLVEAGVDAWGVDASQLRRWQWRERTHKQRLAMAGGSGLPFPDRYFDAVICSGVIEHVGVREVGGPHYAVTPLPGRDEARRALIAELLRVTRDGGTVWLDFPNGAFPIDFWHGPTPGSARWHRLGEGFLPSWRDIVALLTAAAPGAAIRAVSPYRRLRLQQVGRHWWGRILGPAAHAFLRLTATPGFRWLARSRLNPYLVVAVTPPPDRPPFDEI